MSPPSDCCGRRSLGARFVCALAPPLQMTMMERRLLRWLPRRGRSLQLEWVVLATLMKPSMRTGDDMLLQDKNEAQVKETMAPVEPAKHTLKFLTNPQKNSLTSVKHF